jgi:hypothetical protein
MLGLRRGPSFPPSIPDLVAAERDATVRPRRRRRDHRAGRRKCSWGARRGQVARGPRRPPEADRRQQLLGADEAADQRSPQRNARAGPSPPAWSEQLPKKPVSKAARPVRPGSSWAFQGRRERSHRGPQLPESSMASSASQCWAGHRHADPPGERAGRSSIGTVAQPSTRGLGEEASWTRPGAPPAQASERTGTDLLPTGESASATDDPSGDAPNSGQRLQRPALVVPQPSEPVEQTVVEPLDQIERLVDSRG